VQNRELLVKPVVLSGMQRLVLSRMAARAIRNLDARKPLSRLSNPQPSNSSSNTRKTSNSRKRSRVPVDNKPSVLLPILLVTRGTPS